MKIPLCCLVNVFIHCSACEYTQCYSHAYDGDTEWDRCRNWDKCCEAYICSRCRKKTLYCQECKDRNDYPIKFSEQYINGGNKA